MNINREFISTKNTYTGQNEPKYIVIHETDNFTEGSGARRHAQAQAAGHLSISVHYYAGADGVYQAAAHTDGTWSIGNEYDKEHSVRDATNRNTINVEICVNSDGDYMKARQNAIELVRYLIGETGIPAERVIRHFDVKGKYCPRKMMDDPALWENFKAQIADKVSGTSEGLQGVVLRGTVITREDPLNIREIPNGKITGVVPRGAEVEIIEQGGKWHKVKYNGLTGYSAAEYISLGKGQNLLYVAECTGDGVRVRATPGFGDNVIRYLNKGNLFDVLGISGAWTHIRVEGKEGYIYSDYVRRK